MNLCMKTKDNVVKFVKVCMDEMKDVLGRDSAVVRLYWAGDNLG